MAFRVEKEQERERKRKRATNIRLDVIERQQNDVDFDQQPDAAWVLFASICALAIQSSCIYTTYIGLNWQLSNRITIEQVVVAVAVKNDEFCQAKYLSTCARTWLMVCTHWFEFEWKLSKK